MPSSFRIVPSLENKTNDQAEFVPHTAESGTFPIFVLIDNAEFIPHTAESMRFPLFALSDNAEFIPHTVESLTTKTRPKSFRIVPRRTFVVIDNAGFATHGCGS